MPNWFNGAHVKGYRWMREWFDGILGQPFLSYLGSMTQSTILLKDRHPSFFGHLLIEVMQWIMENLLLVPFCCHPSFPASWIAQHHQQALFTLHDTYPDHNLDEWLLECGYKAVLIKLLLISLCNPHSTFTIPNINITLIGPNHMSPIPLLHLLFAL